MQGDAVVTEHTPANPLSAIPRTTQYRLTRAALIRKYVGRRPTTRESIAADIAALLSCRAFFAATDPSVTPDQLVKVVAASKRAETHLRIVAAERPNRRRNPGTRLIT